MGKRRYKGDWKSSFCDGAESADIVKNILIPSKRSENNSLGILLVLLI